MPIDYHAPWTIIPLSSGVSSFTLSMWRLPAVVAIATTAAVVAIATIADELNGARVHPSLPASTGEFPILPVELMDCTPPIPFSYPNLM
ncbi:hypothetical protein Y032_0062g3360 [Ancylostoma ceylanicum]|nr:hypothetical protein Y032_0062g3360 [Ancylostoma ceylanicum]